LLLDNNNRRDDVTTRFSYHGFRQGTIPRVRGRELRRFQPCGQRLRAGWITPEKRVARPGSAHGPATQPPCCFWITYRHEGL